MRIKKMSLKKFKYNQRVNEESRKIKIQEFEKKAIETIKYNYINNLNLDDIIIGSYDFENETFLFTSEMLGNFIVQVPIKNSTSI